MSYTPPKIVTSSYSYTSEILFARYESNAAKTFVFSNISDFSVLPFSPAQVRIGRRNPFIAGVEAIHVPRSPPRDASTLFSLCVLRPLPATGYRWVCVFVGLMLACLGTC